MNPDLLAAILTQGGLGITAAVMTALFLLERREHKTYRDKSERDLRSLLEKNNALREEHATRERSALQTIEYFAKAEVEAVEELGRIASALRKAYERLRR